MSDTNTDYAWTDEQRAKIAALTHALMDIIGESDDLYSRSACQALEEWHDHYRWLDGTDVCDRFTWGPKDGLQVVTVTLAQRTQKDSDGRPRGE